MSVQKIRLLALTYFAVAVALRFLPHGVNFTAVGALAMFVGCYLSMTQGALIALGAMALTDTLGHWLDLEHMSFYDRNTMLAVYASMALPSVLGWLMRKNVNGITVSGTAVASSVMFFLITNFACWLDPNMGYAATPQGLATCYINAIPFASNHFLGTVGFSVAFFGVYWGLSAASKPTALAAGRVNSEPTALAAGRISTNVADKD